MGGGDQVWKGRKRGRGVAEGIETWGLGTREMRRGEKGNEVWGEEG